jgi:hypothetical protein
MNRWDWETLIGKVRAEVGRRYREGLAHQDSAAALWVPLSPRAYREAKWLEEVLLRECAGRSLLDFYDGKEKKTPYGTALVLHETRTFPSFSLSAEVAEAWILSSLRLLYGIGESTETKLRLAGYTSLRELFISPAFGLAGRVNPSGPREARPFRLYPSCHPLVSHFARSPSLASPPSNCLPQ